MINQNTIIQFLSEVVPQMQSSEDAERCLMKMAKENNFSPAVFERACHMFNSLKANNLYDMSPMDKRGSFTSTLDVPSLVNKYSDFISSQDFNENNYHRNQQSFSEQLDLLLKDSDFIEVKVASESGYEDVSKLYISLPEDDISEAEITLSDKVIEPPLLKKADMSYYTFLDDKKREEDVFSEVEEELFQEKSSIITKVASIYTLKDTSPSAFNVVVKYALHFKDGTKLTENDIIEGCKDLFDHIQLLGGSVSEKTAKESTIPSNITLLSDTDAYLVDLFYKYSDVHRKLECLSDLRQDSEKFTYDDFCKTAETATVDSKASTTSVKNDSESKFSTDFIQKVKMDGKIYTVDLGRIQNLYSDNLEAYNDAAKYIQQFPDDFRDRLFVALEKKYTQTQDVSGTPKVDIKTVKPVPENFTSKQDVLDYGAAVVPNKDLYKTLSGAPDNSKDPYLHVVTEGANSLPGLLLTSLSTIGETNEKVRQDLERKALLPQNFSLHEKVKDALLDVENNGKLNELLFLDPVLSKLEGDALNNVLDAYETIRNVYPELYRDTAALRAYLRAAASTGGGVDLNTVKILSDIKKNVKFSDK